MIVTYGFTATPSHLPAGPSNSTAVDLGRLPGPSPDHVAGDLGHLTLLSARRRAAPAPARRRRPAVPSSGPVVGTAPAGRAGVLARLAGRILGVAAAVPAALQVSAPTPGPALHHEGAALRAGPRNRRVPGHETALRVVRAAVKGTPLAA